MRVGLVVPCYNRPQYFKETMHWIKKSSIHVDFSLVLVDDNSNDKLFLQYFDEFTMENAQVVKLKNPSFRGIWNVLQTGFDYLLENKFEILANLDSDSMVKTDWLNKLLILWMKFPDTIISGFNTPSHAITSEEKDFYRKQTIGGLNMLFSPDIYRNIVRPAFVHRQGWDFGVCRGLLSYEKQFIVTKPSVVQHIGYVSNMGHRTIDIAEDF